MPFIYVFTVSTAEITCVHTCMYVVVIISVQICAYVQVQNALLTINGVVAYVQSLQHDEWYE